MVLPSACIVCNAELPWRERVGSCCGTCWPGAERVRGVRCVGCGLPWMTDAAVESWRCGECTIGTSSLAWRDSWGWYRGALQSVLHAFKFHGHDFLSRGLAGRLHEVMVERRDFGFDVIVPVPLHPRRLRRRGFNQAELLANRLACAAGIPSRNLLRRVIETRAQSTLPREERASNVRRAFRASSRVRSGSILLVDDVMTTGATLEACARAIEQCGAERVCAVTVARA